MYYEYNPLLKLNFQKKSEVTPSDISRLEGEISDVQTSVTDLQQKKVTKFFSANDNLEPGEIAQYQGEDDSANGLQNGFFYKKETTAGLILPVGTKIKKYYAAGPAVLYLISLWNNPIVNTWEQFNNIDGNNYTVQVLSKNFDVSTIPEPFKTALLPISEPMYENEVHLTQLQAKGSFNNQKSINPFDFTIFEGLNPNPSFGNVHDLIYCCDNDGKRYITNGYTLWELDENNKVKGTLYDDGDGATLSQFRYETTEEINFSKVTFTQTDSQPRTVFVVNAQSINTNINECLAVLTELKTNDLIILSDIDETKIYYYTLNNTTKQIKGNADFDLLFRYIGNSEFKPIAFSPIF